VSSANLALKFLLELAALAAFAVWGADVGSGATAVLFAIAAPLAVAVLWGLFAAPKASYRLPTSSRIPFELGVFLLAAIALAACGHTAAAVVFVLLALVNVGLLTYLGQWEA
jgi:hypothetical protein